MKPKIHIPKETEWYYLNEELIMDELELENITEGATEYKIVDDSIVEFYRGECFLLSCTANNLFDVNIPEDVSEYKILNDSIAEIYHDEDGKCYIISSYSDNFDVYACLKEGSLLVSVTDNNNEFEEVYSFVLKNFEDKNYSNIINSIILEAYYQWRKEGIIGLITVVQDNSNYFVRCETYVDYHNKLVTRYYNY